MKEKLFTRHNKSYTARWGEEPETGDFPLEVKPQQPALNGMGYEYQFKGLHVEKGADNQYHILTEWYYNEYTPTGELVPGNSKIVRHTTRKDQAKTFINRFLPATIGPILNSIILGILGHAQQPAFDANGMEIPDSAYDTSLPPTHDYHVIPEPSTTVTDDTL